MILKKEQPNDLVIGYWDLKFHVSKKGCWQPKTYHYFRNPLHKSR